MKTLLIVAILLSAADSHARMVCKPRGDMLHYQYKAVEQPGGTCGPLSFTVVYAPRNGGKSILETLHFGGVESHLSANKCVETLQGVGVFGRHWTAVESWDRDGRYMIGNYKVKQEYEGQNCESEYTVTLTHRAVPGT